MLERLLGAREYLLAASTYKVCSVWALFTKEGAHKGDTYPVLSGLGPCGTPHVSTTVYFGMTAWAVV